MATPGQLVETMAEALGIPVGTVTQYDRVLAENGMRSKGGRGPSAAKMTPRDAANLLIAILGAPLEGASVKEAAHTCQTYGSLPTLEKASFPQAFSTYGLPQLKSLTPKHKLVDAVEALIAGAAQGRLFKIPERGRRGIVTDIGFGIEVQGPRPWAAIEVAFDIAGGQAREPRLVYCVWQDVRSRTSSPDLIQKRFVSFRTIRILGSLFSKEKP